ncbi:MAG TPA: metalloregulator ArsR/SmtB family transcription factor [Fibrobacteria bacterium]|nr:metalloregulator ArsR/SmtB family transcription factor [Fibrobacteria bacterium]
MAKVLQIDVLTGIFKLLSDETRLRILCVLSESELAVGELQKILGLGQSTLSTQLGLLKEQDLVASRKEGQKVLYRIPRNGREDPKLDIVENALQSAPAAKWHDRDMRNLKKVLQERSDRSREFFNAQTVQNMPSPGQTWRALCNGLIRLIRGQRIVDLGCGDGRLALLLARAGNSVTGVDSSEEQIRLARGNAGGETGGPVFQHAPMENTGLPASGFDVVILSQSLHHAANPKESIAESHRLLAPGGRILILDLLAHGEEWMRTKFGDFWLGFTRSDLEAWLKESGFTGVHFEITGPTRDYPEIEGLLAQAEKL